MYYNADLQAVEDLLINKYKAKKISFKEVTEKFPCCGIDTLGNVVEIDDSEKTISLYTEDEITARNFYCFLIDDKSILNKFTDKQTGGGFMPEKVLTVIGTSDNGKDISQLYTCFGKCYGWYVDLINLYADYIKDKVAGSFDGLFKLLSYGDGILKYLCNYQSENIEFNLHLNKITLRKSDGLIYQQSIDDQWVENLRSNL